MSAKAVSIDTQSNNEQVAVVKHLVLELYLEGLDVRSIGRM